MTNSVSTDFAAKMQASLVPQSGAPFIAIEKIAGNQALVYWPGWATNYVLETGSVLGDWSSLTTGITWQDNNFQLAIPVVTGGHEFFRLHQP